MGSLTTVYKNCRLNFFKFINSLSVFKNIHSPNGYYETASDYIESIKSNPELDGQTVKIADSTELQLTSSRSIHNKIKAKFDAQKLIIPEKYIYKFNDGSLLGRNGRVITHNNRYIKDITKQFNPNDERMFNIVKPVIKKKFNGTVASIATNYSICYYHWILDIFQKLYVLKLSGLSYNKLLVNRLDYNFQKETLRLLNLSEDEIISSSEMLNFHPKTILTTSHVQFDKDAILWTREQFLKAVKDKNLPQDTPKRLYISRAKAKRRRIVNEDETLKIISKYGFTRVFLENISLSTQINLFKNAEIVIGPHGAGFTNLIFANNNLKIVELFHPSYDNNCFFILASILEMKHYHLYGKDYDSKGKIDMTVDTDELEKMLKLVINT